MAKQETTPTPPLEKRPRGRPRKDGLYDVKTLNPEYGMSKLQRESNGRVSKYLSFAVAGLSDEIIDLSDYEAVEKACIDFLKECAEGDVIPTVAGLSRKLHVDHSYISKLRSGALRANDPRYRALMTEMYQVFEEVLVCMSLDNQCNNIAAIVQLKNRFGYTDEQKIVTETKQSVTDPSMGMADVLAIAGETTPRIAEFSEDK